MTDHAAPGQAETAGAAAPLRKVRSRLFLKYAGLFVAVVCVALLTNGIFEIWVSYREHKEALIQIQHEQAESAAAKIGQFIKEIESQVGWTTQLLWSVGSIEQRRFDALRLLRQVPAITELAQVDAAGKEQLRVSRLAMDVVASGLDLSNDPKFTEAVKNKIYYGPVYFRRESEPYMTLSLAGTRRDAGVSIAEVNLKLIWDVVSKIKVGERGHAYVVDAKGRLIAHPDISLVLRNTDMTRLAQVKAAQRQQADATTGEIETATDIQGRQVLTAYAPVAPLGWTVFVELPVDEAYQPLITSIQRTALVLLAALCLAALAGMFLARRMVVPIQALRAGAARIGGGDLTQRISIKSGDELEALADQFNDMAGKLQESYAGLEQKVEARTQELTETLDQQTATSEVLQVISSSPGELEPVFQVMLANAVRICDATFGMLFRYEDGLVRADAMLGVPPAFAEFWQSAPQRPSRKTAMGRSIETKQVIHIVDVTTDPAYLENEPVFLAAAKLGGFRTILTVPMLKEDEVIGILAIYRQEVRAFTDKQIDLVNNFAAQAVIAIENTRLLTELRESLDQQTATSDVLQVISSSPGELEPVFQAMLTNAVRICDAKFGVMFRYDGEKFEPAALFGVTPEYTALLEQRGRFKPDAESGLGQLLRTMEVVRITDAASESAPLGGEGPAAKFGGARSRIVVPMLNDDELIGAITIYRQEVRPFTDKQVELVQNFAAQAVIAIENTRLLTELRESLEQQTATSDVLQVISSSPGDLMPVFNTMLENAMRICAANFGGLFRFENGAVRVASTLGVPAPLVETLKSGVQPGPLNPMSRVLSTGQAVHIEDYRSDAAYLERDAMAVAGVDLGGIRTLLIVPMSKDTELIGAIAIFRQIVEPFTDKQIELVTNFAAQAVIAIENTRLLTELRESLEQQTATSEVLQVISSSPGELEPVFQAMLSNASRICEAKFGNLFLREGDNPRAVAVHGEQTYVEEYRQNPLIVLRDNPGIPIDRIFTTKRALHITDLRTDQCYLEKNPRILALVDTAGARTLLGVPMLKDDELIGAIVIYRQEVRPFSDKQIELVTNFAAQAVIAIENTRLLHELQKRTDDLSESLLQQTATSDILQVISNSPTDSQPAFDAIVRSGLKLFPGAAIVISLPDGDIVNLAAIDGADRADLAALSARYPLPLSREYITSAAILDRREMDFADARETPPHLIPGGKNFLASGYSGITVMPMLRGEAAIGALSVVRRHPGALSEKQRGLLRTFASQAVIAIENTRLFKELRERTDDLSESLQQQTATADVLKVISRSTFDLHTVLNTLTESAARLCRAERSAIRLLKGGLYHHVASYGYQHEHDDRMRLDPVDSGPGSIIGRVVTAGKSIQLLDAQADPDPDVVRRSTSGNVRSMLGVPLLREGTPIGVLLLQRSIVQPFTDKEIALAETYADQAVIAIENVRLFDEIQDKSRQLAEASKHKSQFLANMSHELRTPMNAILGYTELIMDNIYGEPNEKMRGVLTRVQSNGKHLLGLINDVLDLSKIEAGQLSLTLADFSVKDVVHSVFSSVESLAKNKKLELKVELPQQIPAAHGDERRLTQVLLNLVGNSLKFTDKGEVTIKAEAANGSFTIAVRDTGPGIAEADQRKIFEEFQQADSSTTKEKGGTGLGLAISKRIVEMHGGRLWVESQLGHGSTFFFSIPLNVERQVEPA